MPESNKTNGTFVAERERERDCAASGKVAKW